MTVDTDASQEPAISGVSRAIELMTAWSERWIPSSFVLACLLTLITFLAVFVFARRTPIEALAYWNQGFWQLLEFGMQMSLVVLTGYIVAISPPVSRLLDALAGLPKTGRAAAGTLAFISLAMSWIHWGLGLVGAPIFLRFLIRKRPELDYRLAVAAAYLGTTCTWHAGLSGSAPLLMATPQNFMEKLVGIIPMSTTTFSKFNLILTAVTTVVMTAAVIKIYPRRAFGLLRSAIPMVAQSPLPDVMSHGRAPDPGKPARSFVDWIESSYFLNITMGLLGFAALIVVFVKSGFQMSLNILNFMFLFLGLWLHRSPAKFAGAAAEGVQFVHGIIIQFPFYAGMYGLIFYSGLAGILAHALVSVANVHTFPLIIYWYSGILSYFIPSGGSKWVVEAPYVLAAAKSLGVPAQQAVISYAWGDMSTHFLQPFWAIPLLSIAGLEFRDILGYLGILFLVNGALVSAAFLLMPRVW